MKKNNEAITRQGIDTMTATTMRRPLLWFVAALVVLPTVITCSVGSKGSTAPVAIAVNLPHANGPAVAVQMQSASPSTWWARIFTWIWEPNEAVAELTTQYRLVVDVGAADLPSQVVTVPLDSLGPQTVTVQLNVLSGPGRTFRATLEEQPPGQSVFTPVYAGCHTGVDLQPNAPTNVTIELAETTTCLRVIVLGQGNLPQAGVRVLLHENASNTIDQNYKELVTDSNGIADFGQPTGSYLTDCQACLPPCASTCPPAPWKVAYLSFVVNQAGSSAAQTVITLKDMPVVGDIHFNIAQPEIGNFGGLTVSQEGTNIYVWDAFFNVDNNIVQTRELKWELYNAFYDSLQDMDQAHYQDADALIIKYEWTAQDQSGNLIPYQRLEVMKPYDETSTTLRVNRLEALPTDLSYLVPPDLTTNSDLTIYIKYFSFKRADSSLQWPNWGPYAPSPYYSMSYVPDYLTYPELLHGKRFNRFIRPYIGSVGIFNENLLFNLNQTYVYQSIFSLNING